MNYEQYIKKGWSVIPVGRDKKPLITSWKEYQTRLPTLEEVKNWPKGNIAVITGPVSNLAIIDLEKEGLEYAAKRRLFSPVTVKTGRGKHYYFKHPGEKIKTLHTIGNIKGLDVRGDGGYALLPPSVHESGVKYQWLNGWNAPLPEFPFGFFNDAKAIITTDLSTQKPPDWIVNALNNLSEGNRHQTFLTVAGFFHGKRIKDDVIYTILLPYADKCGFDHDELMKVVTKYPTPVQPVESIVVPEFGSSVEEFLADEQKVDWLVPGIVAKSGLGFIAGLPETLKTWLAMDLAIECAKGGGSWVKKFACKDAKVLFIDQERFKGETQRRFKALLSAKNIKHNELKGKLFIRCGTSTRLDLQHSFEAFRNELAKIKPDLVIVDSFVTFHNAEENDRFTIQKVLEKIKTLRAEFGCTFLFLDHENKLVFDDAKTKEAPSYGRMTGSIAKPAAAELVLTVRKHSDNSAMVYMTKSSLATAIAPFMIVIKDLTEDKSKIVVEGV